MVDAQPPLSYFVAPHELSWLPLVLEPAQTDSAPGLVPFTRCSAPPGRPGSVDFAWVHKVDDSSRAGFESARVRGGDAVAGTAALEDKFNLALLSRGKGLRGLEVFALEGSAAVERWCLARGLGAGNGAASPGLWMVKDSAANCGDGLWVMNGGNWREVVGKLREAESVARRPIRFVVQQYIDKPDLWNDRHKYHIRVYIVLKGDASVHLHERALIHVANKPFSTAQGDLQDEQIHLTNVSKNHHREDLFHGCPVVTLATHLGPERMASMQGVLAAVFEAARPFMLHQTSGHDFSHIGGDIMFDTEGNAHLLELNIPPCIGNYRSEMVPEQHAFFNQLFSSMVDEFVLPPLERRPAAPQPPSPPPCRRWLPVLPPRPDFSPSAASSRGLNALAWRMFERKHKHQHE